MSIETGSGPVPADVLAVPVFADRVWGPGTEAAIADVDGLEEYLDAVGFTGKKGQITAVPSADGTLLLVGLGDDLNAEGLRQAAGRVGRKSRKAARVATTLHQVGLDDAAELVGLGFALGQYSFDEHRSKAEPAVTEALVLVDGSDDDAAAAEAGAVIAGGVVAARDLVNRPPGHKPPTAFAAWATEMAEQVGATIEVFDEDQIAAERFGGLQGVSAGAHNPPRMVVMRYEPAGATKTVAFVGKGIIFDSGGLSLKPPKAMEDMKTDMAGAAAVFGAVQAIATRGFQVNVLAIMPLTENMPGGGAMRPGDVLEARNGKTIEVLNTDAEGRLVLADGLSLAAESSPDLIIDIATLTGACKVALGPRIAGLFSNDDDAAATVVAAARRAGERVWRMPLAADYRPMIDSTIADMKNTGDRWGGAITAALLLEEFVGDVPWVHLDIAGPGRADSTRHYVQKGATGFGVRTLVAVAEDLAAG
ncbi:MAG: leucyl aminopeptidase [Acidimicrobiia bacterium]|nr:leucyl aminopeptidase [Acidimicrobiia bacterium]